MAALAVAMLLATCRRAPWPAGEPAADELEAFVTGGGSLRIGMSEEAAVRALGHPDRRQPPRSPGAGSELEWDHLTGASPGAASCRFYRDELVQIRLAPAKRSLPRIGRDAAQALEGADVVQRAVAKQLRLSDVEAVTAKRGQLVMREIGRGNETGPNIVWVRNYWAWQIERGGEALLVSEQDGLADQPVTRTLH